MGKNERERERYDYLKSRGICVKCGREKALEKRILCLECREKHKETNKARYERVKNTEEYKVANKVSSKAYYDKRKEMGLCPKCGKRKSKDSEYKLCYRCRSRARKDISLRYIYELENRCRLCGEHELFNGLKICKSCYDKKIVKMQEARTKEHPWRKSIADHKKRKIITK